MEWRIYYSDGSTFDNTQGAPWECPDKPICVIVERDRDPSIYNVGRLLIHQFDQYMFSDHIGGWHGVLTQHDMLRHLHVGCGPGGVRVVREGLWIPSTDYRRIISTAARDPDFPIKHGHDPLREIGVPPGNKQSHEVPDSSAAS